MKLKYSALKVLTILFCFNIMEQKTTAQVVPDDTLDAEKTQINSLDELRDAIEGGAIRGDNLFHSFQEFNVGEGATVDFANPAGIENIFSRVTGGNISEIFGTLGVDGAANLFLINPNGIIFGENARLDVNGSFLATTADEINFDNGEVFSAVESNIPTLTINLPIGLGFGSNSQSTSRSGLIKVQGTGHNLDALGGKSAIRGETNNNLTTSPSKTLALIGSKINFEGGVLTSPSGNIEIGSVQKGKVKITDFNQNLGSLSLNYDEVKVFGDISLTNRSLVDVSSIPDNLQLGGGSIMVQGKNITSQDGSVILNQNFGENDSGSVNISASNSFQISGTDPIARILGGIRTETLSKGKGANIEIFTPQLSIFDGGAIQSVTFSPFPQTVSGDINLNVSNLLISGASPQSAFSISNVTTFTFNSSRAGNLSVDADTVNLKNGGILTSTGVMGPVGAITIRATKFVKVKGFEPTFSLSSGISSTNSFSLTPGTVNITSPNIYLQDGGSISTSTFSTGPAGIIVINTDNLKITGEIPKSTFNPGRPSNIGSSTFIFDIDLAESLPNTFDTSTFTNLPLTGNSGNIEINANSIEISDSGAISVLNDGKGDAGNLEINADSISLDNGGEISASTTSGEGGNIDFNTDNLSLLGQSNITASAGGQGNGGNITIDSETLLGLENSDITANAIAGNGGNIEISSDFIFGLESRPELTPFSDITASSELGIDGTVTIFSPESNIGEEVIIVGRDERALKDQDLADEKCSSYGEQRVRVQDLGAPIAPSPFDFPYSEDLPGEQSPIANSSSAPNEEVIVQANTVKVLPDGRTFLVAETKSNHPVAEPQLCTRQ